jgi:hypothetical protein
LLQKYYFFQSFDAKLSSTDRSCELHQLQSGVLLIL